MYYLLGLDNYGSKQIQLGFVVVTIAGAHIGLVDAIVGEVTITIGIFAL